MQTFTFKNVNVDFKSSINDFLLFIVATQLTLYLTPYRL